jgi:hypothetical protein
MKIRLLTAAAVLVSASVHLKLWFDGVSHEHVIGPAFMLNAIGGLAIMALLLLWRHWIPLLLAVGFGVSTIGAFTISATVGLFGLHEHWTGGPVWTALIAEVVAIVTALMAIRSEGYLSAEQPQHGLALRSLDLH